MSEATLAMLADHAAISAIVSALAFSQDDKDWEGLRGLFTQQVHLDLSRVFGEPAVDISQMSLQSWHTLRSAVSCAHITRPQTSW